MKKLASGLAVVFLSQPLFAGTYTVTTLANDGAGSLRQAITSANSDSGSTIAFGTTGTINITSPLPALSVQTTLDGTTAPGYAGTPLVAIDFNGRPGLNSLANGTVIRGLSIVGSGSSGITVQGSSTAIASNYIGVLPNGAVKGNFGDGIRVLASSHFNVIGNTDAVESISYYNTTDVPGAFPVQPVTGWQGIRNNGDVADEYLICGTSEADGLLYIGPIDGGGQAYTAVYPGDETTSTSAYGPDNVEGGQYRLVGSYKKDDGTSIYNHGFVWTGMATDLPSGGTWATIDYPGATYQFTHSTMGNLAVGNADGPKSKGNKTVPIGPGTAYVYNITDGSFTTIVFPKSKSNSAYGIWQNGPDTYTICGGYSPIAVALPASGSAAEAAQSRPFTQGKGFLVDYNSTTKKFSNWTSFDYPNGVNFITHFEGISSQEPGVYTLSADSVQDGTTDPVQGSWVTVRRQNDGSFDKGVWVDLNYPDTDSVASSNSVYGNQVVGIVIASGDSFSFQATVNVEFQLSNVISGNRGNGISFIGSKGNVVSMNYIGSNPAGEDTMGFGNAGNGILLSADSSSNLIGGVASGVNNPTGSKNPANAVFQRPPQGNLISGNLGNGVYITGSENNALSGNFIGTDESGVDALPNGQDGVLIEKGNGNSLLGCTFYQNPFVYYNVVSGNRGNGVRINNSNNAYVQANFLGMGADNATSVPNGGNGLVVSGTSKKTQVGGVIPLGNVISGNTLNGILVTDKVSDFITFNTFGGIAAFQDFASPNGLNGILITSTGKGNVVRTNIFSGNNGNGVEIGGDASGVQVTDTSCGTTTVIDGAIPNQGSGIVISGTAHNNTIGGFQPSVEPTVFASGNVGYGIAIVDQAYNNEIVHTNVGIGAGLAGSLPNGYGGILLDTGTKGTVVGGTKTELQNKIQTNGGAGLTIYESKKNKVTGNSITDNDFAGIYAYGACDGTIIKANQVTGNGDGGNNNVDIGDATGIKFTP